MVTRVLWRERVRRDTVTLAVGADSLLALPSGAGWHRRSGRASVRLERGRDSSGRATIVVRASCDSLERQCEYYERELERLTALRAGSSAVARKKEAEHRPNGILKPLKWCWNGLLAAMAVGLVAGLNLKRILTKLKLKQLWQ